MSEAPVKYCVDPMQPFPKRWEDARGPVRVISGPAEGYVMVRRRGCMPFVLHVRHLLNTDKHPVHGPFWPAPPKKRSCA